MSRQAVSILSVWVVVAAAAAAVIAVDATSFLEWAPLLAGLGLVLSFVSQLLLTGKERLVSRLAITTTGSLAILLLGTLAAVVLPAVVPAWAG